MSTITFRYLTDKEEKTVQYKYRGILVHVDGVDYLLKNDVYFKFGDYIYHLCCDVDDEDVFCESFIDLRRSNAAFEVEYNVVDFAKLNDSYTISGDELDPVAEHIRNTAIVYSPQNILLYNKAEDDYDEFLNKYYDLDENIQNDDDVEHLFNKTCSEVESLLRTMERAVSNAECSSVRSRINSILADACKQLNL
jgi:hypothetical protein